MTFSCMFSCFSWNAQAQIPPRGSFIQKCRFAFGEWLAFRGSDACPARALLLGVAPTLHLLQALFWAGDKGLCAASAEALDKQHSPVATAGSGLAGTATLQPWDGEVPTLYPLLSQPPAPDCVVPPAVLPAAAHHSSCLEFRNWVQLRNVFFCVALI